MPLLTSGAWLRHPQVNDLTMKRTVLPVGILISQMYLGILKQIWRLLAGEIWAGSAALG